MKLTKEVLAEIVSIFHAGLAGKDVSQDFRDLDLIIVNDEGGCPPECADFDQTTAKLTLSPSYLAAHPRASAWTEN